MDFDDLYGLAIKERSRKNSKFRVTDQNLEVVAN